MCMSLHVITPLLVVAIPTIYQTVTYATASGLSESFSRSRKVFTPDSSKIPLFRLNFYSSFVAVKSKDAISTKGLFLRPPTETKDSLERNYKLYQEMTRRATL